MSEMTEIDWRFVVFDKKMSTDPEICDATTDRLYYRLVDVY